VPEGPRSFKVCVYHLNGGWLLVPTYSLTHGAPTCFVFRRVYGGVLSTGGIRMKVGDLVKECLPLMAGDAPERLGIITSPPSAVGFCKVLFDKEEFVHYNSLKKVEG